MIAILERFRHDLGAARRGIAARPFFSLAIVSSLTIAIAANTAVFTVVNSVLFQPLPGITRGNGLVELSRNVNGDWLDLSYPIFDSLRHDEATIAEAAAMAMVSTSVSTSGEPTARAGLAVTGSYFGLLGASPERGRTFAAGEADYPAVAPVVVIGHELSETQFGAVDDVIGRTLRVNGRPLQVIGVMPEGFGGHRVGLVADLFIPFGLDLPGLPGAQALASVDDGVLEAIARLRPGVGTKEAAARLSVVAEQHREALAGRSAEQPYVLRVDDWGPLPAPVRSAVAAFLAALGLLVGLALMMAGTNVTTMFLSRADDRRRELSIRQALGASRGQLTRQLAVENLVLFALAGASGVGLSIWATSMLSSLAPTLPVPARVSLRIWPDWRVLGFSLLVTFGACTVFSIVPAARIVGRDLMSLLRDASGSDTPARARFRRVVIGVQIGVTTLLVAVAALFGRALTTVRSESAGWIEGAVLVAPLDVTLDGSNRERGAAFYRDLLDRARALPGVESAALAAKLPLGGRSSFGPVTADGAEAGAPGLDAALNRVSSGYFRTMSIPLIEGRDFTDQDRDDGPLVAVVNETLARKLWPDGGAAGKRMHTLSRTFEVVGVAANAQADALQPSPPNFYYVPASQWYNPETVLHVRTDAAQADSVAAGIVSIVRDLDPNLPPPVPQRLSDALATFLLPQRLAAWVAGVMGVFCLLLALAGVYSVTAFLISRRKRELAIRAALGATPGDVAGLVLRQNALAPAIGLAVGLGVSLAFARVIGGIVSGVRVDDFVALGLSSLCLALATLAAIATPLVRVLASNPVAALRQE